MPKLKELKKPANPKKLVEKWAEEITKGVLRGGGRIGRVLVYPIANTNKFHVEIEHNLGGTPDYPSHKNIKVESKTNYDGFYDWDADTYLRPCNVFIVAVVAA